MTRRLGVALPAYLVGGLLGLASSLAIGDPVPALLGTPLLLVAVLGALGGSDVTVGLRILEQPDTTVEGEPFTVGIEIGSPSIGRSMMVPGLPPGLRLIGAEGGRLIQDQAIAVPPIRGSHTVRMEIEPVGWGHWRIEPPVLRMTHGIGGHETLLVGREHTDITVLPSPMGLRRLVTPRDTTLHVGDIVSESRGDGTEFADIRAYRPGDNPRALNWRVSNRLDDLWVNDRHPERNGDVIVLVDAQPPSGPGSRITVDRAVRMADALLAGHTRRRHRLGLINLEGVCRWMKPETGEHHRRQLLEQLVSVTPGQVLPEAIERAIHRAARPPAMLIAITPLLDGLLAGALHELNVEGMDVVVVELDVAGHLPPPHGAVSELGRRLWALDRDRIRDKLTGSGIPTTLWREGDPPEVPLTVIEEWRRAWRRALA